MRAATQTHGCSWQVFELTLFTKGDELYGGLKAIRAQIACESTTAAYARLETNLLIMVCPYPLFLLQW
jgi:hypothetical protein